MKIRAIIGSSWGDEGKGRMVDYFADDETIVVRFNGGAQAGHTVIDSAGNRHAFRHFGSGTFKGASTYLSKFFIVNPILFAMEYNELITKHGTANSVYVSPHCFVTTPWDMLINTIIEKERGNGRHGSCGCGINETVVRSGGGMLLNVQLLLSDHLDDLVRHIQQDHVKSRLDELMIDPGEKYSILLKSENIFNNFMRDVEVFKNKIIPMDPKFKDYKGVIFEGAQGLMLDQNHENFPHVTPSNTGLQNVQHLMDDFHLHDDIDVTYVTRSYATRHGAGPFPNEDPEMSYEDETNVPNEHQGDLRFGLLDIDSLVLEISKDMSKMRIPFNPSIAVTCLDQHSGQCVMDGVEIFPSHEDLCKHILADRLNFSKAYGGYGPKTNDHMSTWERKVDYAF